MKVLVTGATGFIASYVIPELLKRNVQVIASSEKEAAAKEKDWYSNVKFITHDISKNTSESLYEDELFLGGKVSGELFSSQSGAASAVRDHIRSVKEARRKKSSGGGVSIGWTNKYNVVKVKEIVTDAQLKVISSTEGYRIF